MLSAEQLRNYDYFAAHLQEYLQDPLLEGKVGVFHNERLVKIFDTFAAAVKYAFKTIGEGFVIQEIVDETQFTNHIYVGEFAYA